MQGELKNVVMLKCGKRSFVFHISTFPHFLRGWIAPLFFIRSGVSITPTSVALSQFLINVSTTLSTLVRHNLITFVASRIFPSCTDFSIFYTPYMFFLYGQITI